MYAISRQRGDSRYLRVIERERRQGAPLPGLGGRLLRPFGRRRGRRPGRGGQRLRAHLGRALDLHRRPRTRPYRHASGELRCERKSRGKERRKRGQLVRLRIPHARYFIQKRVERNPRPRPGPPCLQAQADIPRQLPDRAAPPGRKPKGRGQRGRLSQYLRPMGALIRALLQTTITSKKFEPEALDPFGFSEVLRANEREQLSPSDFVEEGMQSLVRQAYEADLITLSKVAEYLQCTLADARELAGQWQQERGLGI